MEAAGLRRARSVAARRTLLAEYLLVLFPALALACHECLGDAVPPAAAAKKPPPPPRKGRRAALDATSQAAVVL